MTAVLASHELVTVEEFLDAEPHYPVRHEYLGGMAYAMAGASLAHNTIYQNLSGLLFNALRGRSCQAFGPDMKVKVEISRNTYFYYPDATVVCGNGRFGASWCEEPTVIFEILSESTRAIDEREKRMAYLTLPSLEAYVLIEQERRQVIVEWRDGDAWKRETLGPDAILKLSKVEVEIPVSELYERLDLP